MGGGFLMFAQPYRLTDHPSIFMATDIEFIVPASDWRVVVLVFAVAWLLSLARMSLCWQPVASVLVVAAVGLSVRRRLVTT